MLGRMEESSVVYGLYCTCQSRVRYVGKTVGPLHRRVNTHLWEAKTGKMRPVHKWIRKHGTENIRSKVLFWSRDNSELCAEEIRLIRELHTHISEGGLNVTKGGEGSLGVTSMRGEKNAAAKLTYDQVVEIKKLIWSGIATRNISRDLGVSFRSVQNIALDQTWESVPWPEGEPKPRPKGKTSLTVADVTEIKQRISSGESYHEISQEFPISRFELSALRRNRCWTQVPWPDNYDSSRYHHPNALSAETRDSIRKELLAGRKATEVARMFGVSSATVSRIKSGRRGGIVFDEGKAIVKSSGAGS